MFETSVNGGSNDERLDVKVKEDSFNDSWSFTKSQDEQDKRSKVKQEVSIIDNGSSNNNSATDKNAAK